MTRRVGDIYRITVNRSEYAYAQHLTNDSTQLSSNVVFVFGKKLRANEEFRLEQASRSEGFFAHVFLKAGETLKIWQRVAWSPPFISEPIPVLWSKCADKDRQLESTENWLVWRTNEERRAPSNREELTNSELGMVMNPTQILERIEHASYSIKYPRRAWRQT
jgi:hypothetical protein